MSGHLNPEGLEQYIQGALDGDEARALEAHAGSCARCAAALQREARLELGLLEVARAPVSLRAFRGRRARLGAAAAVLAATAAAALAFLVQPRPALDGPPRLVRCEDPRQASECLASAQYEGLLTIGPDDQLVVPRYDQAPRGNP
jgi:anti-sigma factor RsiW